MTRLHRPVEGFLVEEAAAGAVDQADARLHHRDLLVADHVERLFGARRVDGDVVRLAQELLERLFPLHVQIAEPRIGDVGVVGDHPHGEAAGALGDQAADAAQSDDAERLGVELAALELLASPLAALDETVGPGDVAAAGQKQAHRVLRRGDDVALRGVADDDPLLRGVGDVDVVETGTGPSDDAQVDRCVEQALVDERLAAHDDAVVRGDDLEELLVTQTVLDVDLAGRRQLRE